MECHWLEYLWTAIYQMLWPVSSTSFSTAWGLSCWMQQRCFSHIMAWLFFKKFLKTEVPEWASFTKKTIALLASFCSTEKSSTPMHWSYHAVGQQCIKTYFFPHQHQQNPGCGLSLVLLWPQLLQCVEFCFLTNVWFLLPQWLHWLIPPDLPLSLPEWNFSLRGSVISMIFYINWCSHHLSTEGAWVFHCPFYYCLGHTFFPSNIKVCFISFTGNWLATWSFFPWSLLFVALNILFKE